MDSSLHTLRVTWSNSVIIGSNHHKLAICDKVGPQQNIEIYDGNILKKYAFGYNEYINNICFTDQYIWVCTKNGIYRNNAGLSENYIHNFAGKYISCVVKDKNDDYWIGTTNEGIMFIPSLSNRFFTFNNFIPQHLQMVNDQLLMGGKNNEILEFDPATTLANTMFKIERNHEISCFYYDNDKNELLVSSDMFYCVKKGKMDGRGMAVKSICKIDEKYYSIASTGVSGLFRDEMPGEPSVWDSLHLSNLNPNPVLGIGSYSTFLSQCRGKSTVYDETNKRIYYATNNGLYQVNPNEVVEIFYREKKM